MKVSLGSYLAYSALASWAGIADAADAQGGGRHHKDLTADALMAKIKLKDLLDGAQKLQDISDNNGGNRVFGGEGHAATIQYIYDELKATRKFDVRKEEQVHLWSESEAKLSVTEKEIETSAMSYSPSGDVTADMVLVKNLGCAVEDFGEAKGKIAFLERGDCTFAEKTTNAAKAEALGAIMYNNVPGDLAGNLGGPSDDYVPVVGISQEDGQTILSQFEAGPVTADLWVETEMENRTTWNVIAQTKSGDPNNVVMLGAHSDSVDIGPGINDNASGTIGILTIAKALAGYRLNNAVRFGWWTAEEFGLLGSAHYVENLDEKELEKLRLYLNFDMIASPNYASQIYDGDGSSFNITGPAGSGDIEALFQQFYDEQGLPHRATEFDGRSDYDAFIQNGVPAGGIATGAEELKTEEEVKLFGGEAGVSYDYNYHGAGDDINNLHKGAFLLSTRGAAYAAATYSNSLRGFPPREKKEKRDEHSYAKLSGSKGCSHRRCTY